MNKVFSKKATTKQIEIVNHYMKTHAAKSNDPNVEYFYKTSKYTIAIYKNKTILVQGSNYDWILKLLKAEHKSNEKQVSQIENYIGSDESGTGDFFGGMTVAAAYVPKENLKKIEALDIKDSKKMNDQYIFEIIDDIKKLCNYELCVIEPKEYNDMYEKHQNIKKIIAFLHLEAIEKLANKININHAVIDQFVDKKVFFKYLDQMNLKTNLEINFFTKAEDKFINIAVASVIARWAFLNQIRKLESIAKANVPLGASNYIVIPAGKKILTKNNVRNFVKMNFKTLEKISFK